MVDERFELSVKDRAILINQCRILAKLHPDEDDAKYYEEMEDILKKGYEFHYTELNPIVLESRVSYEACDEVQDILNMYRVLRDSFDDIKEDEKSGIDRKDVQFQGFDGNNESSLLSYLKFLLRREDWDDIFDGRPKFFDFNTHMRSIEIYRRMLAEWKDIGTKPGLTGDEIKRIIGARIHPDYRK